MKLINTDGMAFIGPGSEWFWTALSGLVLAVTFIAIYRQLRLQAGAGAIAQLDSFEREWTSERITRYQLEVLVALRDDAEPAAVPTAAAEAIAGFWEKIGFLTRAGHIDRKPLWNGQTIRCQSWWATLAPFVRRLRAEDGDPLIYEGFEWLAGLMAEMDRRAGMPTNYEGRFSKGTEALERRLTAYQDQLRVEQALRTVIVSSPDAVIVRPPTAAVTAPSAATAPAAQV